MAQPTGYSRIQIVLHWTILFLIIANYLTGEAMIAAFDGFYEDGVDAMSWQAGLHVWFGTAILAAVALRLGLRWRRGVPPLAPQTHDVMAVAAHLTHAALYGLLMAVPALGMLAWFAGWTEMGDVHVVAMNVLMTLITLHAGAALFHHYVLRDGLLMRMMRPS
ncbi:MAG: cytochrome b [Limimaricola sp.]|uniref:cytochrome b n=1 Tax=Limimaricola sp. TaxID=2211665 RepID=UPI001D515820|nr:cytochrome b/b6 domain-containing protein [Limimaricola sp.]MBI1417822.1 cytochrome b [Limimaricola sp.]